MMMMTMLMKALWNIMVMMIMLMKAVWNVIVMMMMLMMAMKALWNTMVQVTFAFSRDFPPSLLLNRRRTEVTQVHIEYNVYIYNVYYTLSIIHCLLYIYILGR